MDDKIFNELLNRFWDQIPAILMARIRHLQGDHDLCWILNVDWLSEEEAQEKEINGLS